MRHIPIVAILIISVFLDAGATRAPDPKKIVPAVPFALAWTRTTEASVTPVAAAGSESGLLLVGFPDRVDAFALATGDSAWSLPIPSPFLSCGATVCLSGEKDEIRALSLPPSQPAVVWRAKLPAPLAFAPVQRAGWVFAATTKGDVLAFSDSDGRKVWEKSVGSPLTAAPSVDGVRIVAATTDQRLVMFDVSTGAQVWDKQMHATLGAPKLGGGRVYVGTSAGTLLAVDVTRGNLDYEQKTLGMVIGTPALDEELVYTAGQDGVLRAFDRGNGAQRWFKNLETRPTAGLTIDENLVVVPLRTGAFRLFLPDERPAGTLPPPKPTDNDARLSTAPFIVGRGATLTLVVLTYDLLGWTATVTTGAAYLPLGGLPVPPPAVAPKEPTPGAPTAAETPAASKPPAVILPPGPFPGTLIALTPPR